MAREARKSALLRDTGDAAARLDEVRSRLAHVALLASAILTIPALAASLARIPNTGWRLSMVVQIALVVVLWSVLLFGRRCSARVHIWTVVGALAIAGVGAFWSFGLIAAGRTFLVVGCVMMAIFYGTRGGVFATVLACCLEAAIAMGVGFGWIRYDLDFNAYAIRMDSWIADLVVFALLALIATVSLGMLRASLIRSLVSLGQRTAELEQANAQLNLEIETRRQTEEALQESEGALADAQRLAHVGSWSLNLATGVIHWSRETFRITGFDPDQPPPSFDRYLDRVHPDDRPRVREHLTRVASLAEDMELDQCLAMPDGTLRWTHTIIHPLRDEAGRITHAFGAVIDVTESKLAEQALRESRELLRSVVEGTSDAVYVKDANGRYLLINRAAAEFVGKPAAEILGHDDTFVFPAGEARAIMESDRIAMKGDGPATYEEAATTADGELRTFQSTKGPLRDHDGKLKGLFGVARDITDRRKAEEELARYRNHLEELVQERTRQLAQSREQLQRAERLASIGTLAAGIAHELNNPLGMMLLGTDLALASLADPEKLGELLRQQRNGIERCGRIVRGVLDFASRRSGEKTVLDLNAIVRHGLEFTREFARTHGVVVDVRLADALAPVLGNSTELEQVVANLAYNAVQACSEGGHVGVETRGFDDAVGLLVSDDGCGMTIEQLEHIFDPFYTTRLEKGGTGLGLSIVHGIVSNHGGTIQVDCGRGPGTVFTVRLPRYVPPVDPQAAGQ